MGIVAAACRGDKQSRPAAGDTLRRVPRVLNDLPYICHQQPLLGIHQLRFMRRDAEEKRIKFIDPVNEPTPFEVCLVPLRCGISVNSLPIPATVWNLRDAVSRFLEILPEGVKIGGQRKASTYSDDGNRFRTLLFQSRGTSRSKATCPLGLGDCPSWHIGRRPLFNDGIGSNSSRKWRKLFSHMRRVLLQQMFCQSM